MVDMFLMYFVLVLILFGNELNKMKIEGDKTNKLT